MEIRAARRVILRANRYEREGYILKGLSCSRMLNTQSSMVTFRISMAKLTRIPDRAAPANLTGNSSNTLNTSADQEQAATIMS